MTRRKPEKYNWNKLEFDETLLKKHFTPLKSRKIKFVVIHHMTIIGRGTGSANDACYGVWQKRAASAHYGVDGKFVRQFVWDKDRAWSTGNNVGNDNGISIEHANSTAGPTWKISEDTLATSAKLVAFMHVAHKLGRPVNGKTVKRHKDFKATACPGPHFNKVWSDYVKDVQAQYDKITKPQPVPTPVAKTRYKVITAEHSARSGPGTGYPVKAVRPFGFEFNSAKQSGDWVQATKHWYNKNYLEVVQPSPPKPAPSKPADLRVGTLNLPLDSAKIPNGTARAKIAAKQIQDSDLGIVALQELSRGKGAVEHSYANKLLKELGEGWKMVKPTTNWNENYLFYRPSEVTFLGQSPDLILRSSAGGRHATRADFKVSDRAITVMSTHFVNGKDNGKSREAQGTALARYAGKSTLILGDLNQDAVPAALSKTHKTCRKAITLVLGAVFGTYFKWGRKGASTAEGSYLDHILVPKDVQVRGYNLVGVSSDGVLTQPRASDHLLVIASLRLEEGL